MIASRWFVIASLGWMLTACAGQLDSHGPCEGANPLPTCGSTCSNSGECGNGLYCDANGACTAECLPGGVDCGPGYACNIRGQCERSGNTQPGPGVPSDDNCATVEVQINQVVPTVQLVIDQSGSMDQNFGGIDRWDAVERALVSSQDGVVTRLEAQVKFGATLYTSFDGNEGGTCPQLEEIAPAINNFDDIRSLFRRSDPEKDTPTAEALAAVVASFPPPDPAAAGKRVIVLATDGNPDTCADPDAHDESSQRLSETAVQNAYAADIETYVLSVGDEVSEPHLKRMANAGLGQDLDTGTAPFFVANDPDELVKSFNQIVGNARDCKFTVNGEVSDPTTGQVELNGQRLEYGTDWDMSDSSTLELLGAACQTVLNENNVDLTAEFACDAIVIIK